MNLQDRVTKFFPGLPLRSPSFPIWSLGIWILGSTGTQAIATTPVPLNSSSFLVLTELQPHPEPSTLEKYPEPPNSLEELEATSIDPSHFNSLELRSSTSIPASTEIHNSQALSAEAGIVALPEDQFITESQKHQASSVAALLSKVATEPEPAIVSEATAGVAPTPQIAVAGPENFNPELRVPPPPVPPSPPAPTPPPVPVETPQETEPTASREPDIFKLENLQIDFRDNQDQSGQHNQWIEPTAQFQLGSKGDRLLVKTGFNTFEEPDTETVTNIPIQIGWQTKVGKSTLQIAAGADFFNRLPAAFNLNVQASVPLSPSLTVTGVLEQGPYKANARTLENQITTWRFGPNLFWQIDRKTTLFSSFRVGLYNDGNSETQSFSRLERKFGQFHAATNLFSWNVRKDMQAESGYFSPPDFLVYNGEIGWQGQPFDFLRCRLTANLGGQRLKETVSSGYSYQGLCTAELSRSIELDLGYTLSNIFTREAGESSSQSNAIVSQLRVKF